MLGVNHTSFPGSSTRSVSTVVRWWSPITTNDESCPVWFTAWVYRLHPKTRITISNYINYIRKIFATSQYIANAWGQKYQDVLVKKKLQKNMASGFMWCFLRILSSEEVLLGQRSQSSEPLSQGYAVPWTITTWVWRTISPQSSPLSLDLIA